MSQLNENYQASIQITQPSGTLITLSTANQYVPSNIQLTISAPNGALAVGGGGLSEGAGSASLSASEGFYNGTSYNSNDKITLVASQTSGYYKLLASGSGTVNRAAITKQVTTAGWFAQDNAAVTPTGLGATSLTSNTGTEDYYIKKSTTKKNSDSATYGDTTITPGSSSQTVTISDGYYPSNRTVTINAISETSAVGTIKSGSAIISTISIGSYNITNNNFPITGSATIGNATVETAGYVSDTKGTKLGNTASLNATIARIAGSTGFSMDSGNATRSPSISRQGFTINGVTNAADTNTAVQTSNPSSGAWIAVKSSSNTGTLTATPSITTAGYGTTGTNGHNISANTIEVGAAESSTTYVKIKSATVTSPDTTATIGDPSFVTASGTNQYKFKLSASGTIAKPTVSAEGYIKSNGTTDVVGTRNTGTISGDKYLTRVTVGAEMSTDVTLTHSLSKGSVGSGEGWTNAASSGSAVTSVPSSGVYVKVTAAALSKEVTATGKVTSAGYGGTTYTTNNEQYIKAAAASKTVSAAAASLWVPIKAAGSYGLSVANSTGISGSSEVSVGNKDANDNYPITANNLSVTATLSAGTNGWFSSGSATDSDVDSCVVGKMPAATFDNSGSNVYCTGAGYVPQGDAEHPVGTITTGGITAVSSDPGSSYTAITSNVTIASGGYLKITAGYYGNSKISLATLVPDEATTNGFATYADGMLAGVVMYDSDGVKRTGNVQTYDRTYTVSTT